MNCCTTIQASSSSSLSSSSSSSSSSDIVQAHAHANEPTTYRAQVNGDNNNILYSSSASGPATVSQTTKAVVQRLAPYFEVRKNERDIISDYKHEEVRGRCQNRTSERNDV